MADARWVAYHSTRGAPPEAGLEVTNLSLLPKLNHGLVPRELVDQNTTEILTENEPLPDISIPEHVPTKEINDVTTSESLMAKLLNNNDQGNDGALFNLPAGTYFYTTTSGLAMGAPNIKIKGSSRENTILHISSTISSLIGPGVRFSANGSYWFENLTIVGNSNLFSFPTS
jgi:hypothetical protein